MKHLKKIVAVVCVVAVVAMTLSSCDNSDAINKAVEDALRDAGVYNETEPQTNEIKLDFQEIYDSVIKEVSRTAKDYLTISDDKISISIGGKNGMMKNYEGLTELITTMNKHLDLPDYLHDEIISTRSTDGKLSEDFGDITVSWYATQKSNTTLQVNVIYLHITYIDKSK